MLFSIKWWFESSWCCIFDYTARRSSCRQLRDTICPCSGTFQISFLVYLLFNSLRVFFSKLVSQPFLLEITKKRRWMCVGFSFIRIFVLCFKLVMILYYCMKYCKTTEGRILLTNDCWIVRDLFKLVCYSVVYFSGT